MPRVSFQAKLFLAGVSAAVLTLAVAGLLFDHVGVPSPSIVGAVLVLVAAGLVAVWGLHRLDSTVPSA